MREKQHGIRTDTQTLKLIDRGTDFGNDRTHGLKQKKLSQSIRKKKKRKEKKDKFNQDGNSL